MPRSRFTYRLGELAHHPRRPFHDHHYEAVRAPDTHVRWAGVILALERRPARPPGKDVDAVDLDVAPMGNESGTLRDIGGGHKRASLLEISK
jgi:hypothetical protein